MLVVLAHHRRARAREHMRMNLVEIQHMVLFLNHDAVPGGDPAVIRRPISNQELQRFQPIGESFSSLCRSGFVGTITRRLCVVC